MTRVKCGVCSWIGELGNTLLADNPFNPIETIYGCHQCKSVNSIYTVCDEPECTELATFLAVTNDGERNTCFQHIPDQINSGE